MDTSARRTLRFCALMALVLWLSACSTASDLASKVGIDLAVLAPSPTSTTAPTATSTITPVPTPAGTPTLLAPILCPGQGAAYPYYHAPLDVDVVARTIRDGGEVTSEQIIAHNEWIAAYNATVAPRATATMEALAPLQTATAVAIADAAVGAPKVEGLHMEWNPKEERWEYLEDDASTSVVGYWDVAAQRFQPLKLGPAWEELYAPVDADQLSALLEDQPGATLLAVDPTVPGTVVTFSSENSRGCLWWSMAIESSQELLVRVPVGGVAVQAHSRDFSLTAVWIEVDKALGLCLDPMIPVSALGQYKSAGRGEKVAMGDAWFVIAGPGHMHVRAWYNPSEFPTPSCSDSQPISGLYGHWLLLGPARLLRTPDGRIAYIPQE